LQGFSLCAKPERGRSELQKEDPPFMKKILTFTVVAVTSVYYAVMPFIIAKADATPPITMASAVLHMRVTAYSSEVDETDDTPFIMADGNHVYDGAAASNILPFGTRLEFPDLFGNKIFTVEDRTSKRFSNTIDLWMPSRERALIFGVNHTTIIVLASTTDDDNLAMK
jgi:3D (Asp-Asp-Asp) domain-containing protein